MSTPATPPAPVPPSQAAAPTPPPRRWPSRLLWIGGLIALAALTIPFFSWWSGRFQHSITEDAFVEAHIVNIAPQSVSGHLVRFHVEEDEWVPQGKLLAEIDPVPFQDQVNIAKSKVDTALAELHRQEAALDRLGDEVPIQIAIAERTLDAALADQARAEKSLKLTEDEFKHGVKEAQAALDAARAEEVLAEQEYERFTSLYKERAAPERRAQEVRASRDAAVARRKLSETKLAKARDDETRVEVMKRTLDAAKKTALKAASGVALSKTGNDQIREMRLLVAVKNESVEDARRVLKAAQNNLDFTKIYAPFPGVVVKRYRHLEDFASPGVAILSMYNPELIYVTANLEETRLQGVAPGNPVELQMDAFAQPFRGRVVWIDKSTGAQFALMPRNVVSGEFTKVVQRVPVRIAIEKDERWSQLRAGLSVRAVISHGAGDPEWAHQMAQEMKHLEKQYNRAQE